MPFCIAGMHRSGTSMVSHMLFACGANLGRPEELDREPVPSNLDGHWENSAFRQINTDLLASLGGAWDFPPPFPDGWETRAASGRIGDQARQKVQEYSALAIWGWKDPRNSLVLPFWKRIIPELEVIVCVRDPLEVATSLATRTYTSDLLAIDLWTTYHRRLLADLSENDRLVTHYDAYFSQPEAELRRVAAFIGLDLEEEGLKQACAVPSGGLRHEKSLHSTAHLHQVLPSETARMYDQLCMAAGIVVDTGVRVSGASESRGTGAAPPRLAPAPRFADSTVVSLLVEKETELASTKLVLQHQESALSRRDEDIRNRMQEIARLETQTAAQARKIVDLEAKAKKLDQLAQRLASQSEELSEAKVEWAALRSQIDTIHASTGLRLLQKYWSLRDRLFPPETFWRTLYNLPMGALRWLAGLGRDSFWLAARDVKEAPRMTRVAAPAAPVRQERPEGQDVDLQPLRETYEQMARTAANQALEDYVPIADKDLSLDPSMPRLIAFYLPQYHPIPENDAWWGKGFTEWSNVSKAVPQFVGHYQPRLPGELGFYDLRVLDVQKRQIELARKYGIYGFCIHYYWFAGKRLLEKPLDQFLQHTELDFPFCICWANENWTRRWDGADSAVLIAQEHTPQADARFIEDVIPVLRDPRYIRVGERPLLIVYRPDILPEPMRTVEVWKEHSLEAGIGEAYIVAAQTFGLTDPRPLGFDAAVQFPPHNTRPRPIRQQVQLLNPGYHGNVHDYEELVDRVTQSPDEPPPYELFRTVIPGWDNEPRKPGAGRTFINTSPEAYGRWLLYAAERTLEKPDPAKRLLFINAWNEWAEGAYLEPDRRYGYAYLQATADSLRAIQSGAGPAPHAEQPEPAGLPAVQDDRQEALIATVPRSGTLLLVTFLKMYDYLLTRARAEEVDRTELFRQYDFSRFHNIGFKALHVGHGYCPGYEEFGEGATKEKWDAIEATSHWFDEAGAWIRENRHFLYPNINPSATIVFVYRNPYDFVLSMYRHFENHKDRPSEWPIPMEAFIDLVMPQYLKTYISFAEGQRRYPQCLRLISYETLMQDRAGTLHSILHFLHRPVGDEQEAAFQAALRHTEPPVMRELELFLGHTLAGDQSGSVESVSHMRGGQVGGFREVLAPPQIARINEYLRSFDLRPEDFGVEIDGGVQPETPRREITAAATKSSEIYNTFHCLPDDEWIEIIVHSPKQPTVGGVRIPGLPGTDLQWRLVGTSGGEALRDASRFYREMRRYCGRLRIELGPASRILDFGCGFGRHLRFFLKDVPPEGLVGVDVAAEAIEACTATLPMCQFQAIDPWPPTSFPAGSYDLVFSYSVFSHLNEHIAGAWVKEFARILRPGGVLILSTHSRVLIDRAALLRRKPKYDHPWEERIARKAFLDTAAAHLQFERGEFLYASTGEGEAAGAFSPTLYGNAIISPGYVSTHWMADFELIDFVDDQDRLQQAMIVMRRKGAGPKLAMTPVLGTNKGLAGSAPDLAEPSAPATPRDSAAIRGNESVEVRPSSNRIVWKSETEFELEGVNFKCILADYDQHHTTPDQVILIKSKSSIELYQKILEKSPPSNVLEFGTFEGGSPVLLSLLYNLRKYVGVDLRSPVPGLAKFLASHPVGKRIHIHYRVSQDDGAAIRKIAASEFGNQPIDLIIDDASHQYAPSRRTFEIAFPLLRPGGTYVLEDWGWAHWPHFKMWEDAPGLSNLIFQLTMACAATPQLVREVLVFPGFAFITKSAASGTEELNLDALVGARGKRLGLI